MAFVRVTRGKIEEQDDHSGVFSCRVYFEAKDVEAMQPHIRAFVDRAVTFTACPDCGGTRLAEAARD